MDEFWTTWEPREHATLLFVIRDGQILLIRKKRGLGAGKINGPGGRIEPGETAHEAAIRETQEELGVTPLGVEERGVLHFQFTDGYSLRCTVFVASDCAGTPIETDEADPIWTPLDAIPFHEMWADDIHWLPGVIGGGRFTGYFHFDGEKMLSREVIWQNDSHAMVCVVMGVCGCGKSTLARGLAKATDGTFLEGDDFHPAANKEKMAAGIPLTDADRDPWYEVLIAEMRTASAKGAPVFLSCSALKKLYRDRLRAALPGLRFIYLKGDRETLHARVAKRKNHFMPASLLDSQLATLEEPRNALVLDIRTPVQEMLDRALADLGLPKPA